MQEHQSAESLGPTSRRLIALTHWNRYHPWPPIGGLRHLVFHAKTNGFHAVIRRVGRRILIDEQAFFRWVDAVNGSDRRGL